MRRERPLAVEAERVARVLFRRGHESAFVRRVRFALSRGDEARAEHGGCRPSLEHVLHIGSVASPPAATTGVGSGGSQRADNSTISGVVD